MKTGTQIFVLFLLMVLSFSCDNQGHPAGFDYGKVENNKYTNSFFNFEMSVPTNWSVQSREQTDNLSKIGKDMVSGSNKKMKEVLDASEINSANLLAAFKYDLKTAVQYNPNLMIVAENLKNAPDIKTGGDYLAHTRNFLKQSQVPHDHIDDASKKTTIGGKEFYSMSVIVNYMGLKIHQTYYATILDGFSVVTTISYIDENQKKELQNAVNSITFN